MNFDAIREKIEELPKSKQELANSLFSKLVFMDAELEKLQEILKVKGWTETYQNGSNQFGIKKSSESDSYNALIKNYKSVVDALNNILPKEETTDGFDEWLNK